MASLAEPDLQKVHVSVGVRVIMVETRREFISGSESVISWLDLRKLFVFFMLLSPSHFLLFQCFETW